MTQLNDKQALRRLGVTRRQLLEEIDRPALKALPDEPYEYSEWRVRRVGVDYHVDIDAHYYSVPYRFARAEVEARLTARGVEIFHKGERIAVHLRGSGNRKHTTVPEHMPSSHRRYAGWTIERIRDDARKIGPATAALCEQILEGRPHPEQGYRACLGIVRLAGSFGAARVEAAAERAIEIGARTYGSVKSILDNKLDRRPAPNAPRGDGPDPPSQHPRAALLPLGDANVLKHPTLDQLHTLGLHGMAKAFADLAAADQAKDIAHADWLALLLDRETSWRRDKRLTARLRAAKLRQQASVEDVDYRAARGLDRALFQKLSEGEWIDAHDNLALVGPVRRRQKLARLRHRPESLPRQSLRPLSSLAEALRGPGARPRRRPPSAPHQIPRPRRSAHSRRLRPRTPRRRRPSRSARNSRGAIRPPIDDRHLPASPVCLA